MKVALFFDSKNFSMALQGYDPTAEIDYNKLASWLTSQVSSGKGDLVGCYYYTGYTSPMCGGPADFNDFLDGLEEIGYVVKREPHVDRRGWCKKCNSERGDPAVTPFASFPHSTILSFLLFYDSPSSQLLL